MPQTMQPLSGSKRMWNYEVVWEGRRFSPKKENARTGPPETGHGDRTAEMTE
jgi:hypothetical protein